MKLNLKRASLALASAGLLTIYGCGGGGGSAVGATGSPVTLTVTSATGAAFVGAVITVTDKNGTVVGTSAPVGANGLSTITLNTGAAAPFVLTAKRTSANGEVESLVSVIPTSSGSASVNITPITNLIASRLSPTGDPTKLAAEVGAGTATINATTVANTVTDVQSILQPLINAIAGSSGDPLTGTFTTNGTAYDKLLDSVKVTIVPASATSTNVEIGIRQTLADGVQPTTIPLISGTGQTAASSAPTLPTITGLVADGTSTKIAAHLAQLTSCYALPLVDRVDTTISNGLATGTAVNVKASACKDAFIGSDPATYKSNGNVVGRNSSNGGAFASLFREGATGVVFSQGAYEFARSNNDLVVSYKSRDVSGNETFDTFVLRADTDGKLKQIGNQYTYGGGVSAYQQRREFVNQSVDNYFSTGYTLNVPLISGIAYVKVTTPKTTVLTLIPGSDGMVFPKLNSSRQPVDSSNIATNIPANMVASGTTYLRVRSEYLDTASTALHPSMRETGLFFSPTDDTDAAIASYSNNSVWKFQYFDSSNVQQGADQYYKTRIRARTIAEVRTQVWANLNTTGVDFLKNAWTGTYTPLPSTNNVTPTWEVPTGALPPTSLTLFGNTRKWVSNAFVGVDPYFARTSFNDSQNVASTLRTTVMACADGNGEKHCNTPAAGYQSYTSMSGLHLFARNAAGSEFARFYATYVLP